MNLKDYLDIVTSLVSLGGIMFFIYHFFRNPDIRADKLLGINKVACEEKHKRLDEIICDMREKFKNIDTSITFMKENDIKHIEQEMRIISERQGKILAILEYRDKMKLE